MAVKDIGVKPTDKVPFAIVKRWAQEALRGDLRAAIEMANRVEGPPVQTLQHQGLEGFYQAEPGEPRQREILARIVSIAMSRRLGAFSSWSNLQKTKKAFSPPPCVARATPTSRDPTAQV